MRLDVRALEYFEQADAIDGSRCSTDPDDQASRHWIHRFLNVPRSRLASLARAASPDEHVVGDIVPGDVDPDEQQR